MVLISNYWCCSSSQNIKEDAYYSLRKTMVTRQIEERGVRSKKVLDAMIKVPRHIFVPPEFQKYAYEDTPLPIGYNQTISQPYMVAYMTEVLEPDSTEKILEIGTGSGYQAAILSLLYKEVYSIEIIEPLGEQARNLFNQEGYRNIQVKIGDGYLGWNEYAPFDAIIVTCAPTEIPQPLMDQLAEGGKMIIPVGGQYNQVLYLLTKTNGKIQKTKTLPVIFVPMIHSK